MDLLQILQMHSFKPSGNRESIWGGQIGIVNITDIWNRIDTCMDTDSRQQNTKAHAHGERGALWHVLTTRAHAMARACVYNFTSIACVASAITGALACGQGRRERHVRC